jgi:glutathione S-transferase
MAIYRLQYATDLAVCVAQQSQFLRKSVRMKLYGSSFSPFVRKIMVYCAERGLPYELENITLDAVDPEFLRASPLRKMPAMTHGDFAVSDSTAILTYLEKKHPDGAMLSADPADAARTVWFEEFADTLMSVVVFKCFFNRVVAPLFQRKPGNADLAAEGEEVDLPKLLDYLESVAPDPGGFLVGGAFGIADIAVASMAVNFDHACDGVDWSRWPRTRAWLDSVHARPSFAGIIAKEQAILAKLRG